jgi:3-hydroxypropanoate dehydrogenase
MTTTLNLDALALAPAAQALLFRDARTANAYSDEPVDDAVLKAVFDLVRWAPTSMNCQPLRILALRSAASRSRLLPHMAEGNRDKVTDAPLVLLLAADHSFTTYMPQLFPYLDDPDAVFGDPGFRGATADYNAAMQVAYLILGVRAAGLGAGPMAGFDRAGVDAEFFPDGRLRASLVMTLGVPDPEATRPRLPRLDYDAVVTTH